MIEDATRSGSFHVTQRWLGGTLTNFKTISRRTRRLQQIEAMIEDGTLETYPKKDQLAIRKEQARLVKFFDGIKEMRKLPQALFVIDPRVELNAVLEARKLRIPVFGIVDTNSDPNCVDFLIPANDDANKSIEVILDACCAAIVEGIEERKAEKVDTEAAGEAEAPKATRKRSTKARVEKAEVAQTEEVTE